MKTGSNIASFRLETMKGTIGKLAMAGALVVASTTAHAQQAADPSSAVSASATAAPAAASKKTMKEKMAIAAGVLGAAFAAFKVIKASTQASAPQTAAPPSDATVK